MIDKLQSIIDEYNNLSDLLSDASTMSDSKKFAKIAKKHKSLMPIVEKGIIYIDKAAQLASSKEMLNEDDLDIIELAREEVNLLLKELDELEKKLKILLIPTDPNDDNNIILEIRCGTGGNEAALFAGDLMRMYLRYVERKNWSADIISMNENEGGGTKEVIIHVKGDGAYGYLKFESGVHRVQRVPETRI